MTSKKDDAREAPRDEHHAQRLVRKKFLKSFRRCKLYARRGLTVEPFHDWFKNLTMLDHNDWRRCLNNHHIQLWAQHRSHADLQFCRFARLRDEVDGAQIAVTASMYW